jgi:hypothetical protein
MKQKKTKADVIRSALAQNPETKIVDIAKMLKCDPQEIYMVRYHDKKRASKKAGAANKSPKRVAIKKPAPGEFWASAGPTPEWVKPHLAASEALSKKIEEIKASQPDPGKPMALWEIVVICLVSAFAVNLGMRFAGVI